MKALKRLCHGRDRELVKLEVEEELQLHLDLLTEECVNADVSKEKAKMIAQKRFGDFEQIRDQCVAISRRNSPLMIGLKAFLTLVFVAGVLVRIYSPEYHITRVGDMLIANAVLGRLLLYIRSRNAISSSKPEGSSPLNLSQEPLLFSTPDQSSRTRIERVIFDK